MAFVLVITVVALATLVGWAMLSSASLQAAAATNHSRMTAADYLAESAVHTASYYLQRDLAGLPAAWTGQSGYIFRGQGVTISGVNGSFDVAATSTAQPDVYNVQATGYSQGSSGLARTATARVKVLRASPTYSTGAAGPLTMNARNYVNGGALVANGTVDGAGTVNAAGGIRTSFNSNEFRVPGTGSLLYYGGNIASGTYTMPSGVVGTPQILSSGTISSPATLTPAANNPGKVFYYPGNLFISGSGTYEGTIIARGKVEFKFVSTTPSPIVMNRVPGFPAIVADGSLSINNRNLNVNINGVVYAGAGTGFATALNAQGSTIRINGALLVGSGSLGNGNQGTLIVNYTPANNDVENLTTVVEPPLAVKFLDWQQ